MNDLTATKALEKVLVPILSDFRNASDASSPSGMLPGFSGARVHLFCIHTDHSSELTLESYRGILHEMTHALGLEMRSGGLELRDSDYCLERIAAFLVELHQSTTLVPKQELVE